MWTIFKVFIEFVTILLLFYILVFWPWGMWDLSSPPRDQTRTPCIGRQSLTHWTTREVPLSALWIYHPILSWPLRSLLRNPLIAYLAFPSLSDFFSLAAFKILCLLTVILLCLGKDHFKSKILDALLASWTWMSKSLCRFGNFLAI